MAWWKCDTCDYTYLGDVPPKQCPQCCCPDSTLRRHHDAFDLKKFDELGERLRANKDAAVRNGIVMVKMSERRFIIVGLSPAVIGEAPLSCHHGELLFGPKPKWECVEFMNAELRKRNTPAEKT